MRTPSRLERRRTRARGPYRSQRPDSVKPPRAESIAAYTFGPLTMWIEPQLESGANVLYLQGRWRLAHVPGIAAEVEALRLAGDHCVLDGSRLEELDTAAGFVLLHRLAELGCIART